MANKFETAPLGDKDNTKPVVSLPRRANGEEYKMGEVVHGVIGELPAEEPSKEKTGNERPFDGNHVAIDLMKEGLTPEEFDEYGVLKSSIVVEIERWSTVPLGATIEKAYESAQEGDTKYIADIKKEIQAVQDIVPNLERISELVKKARERLG